MGEWLETHPAALQAIVGKALTAARAADAAKKARELVSTPDVGEQQVVLLMTLYGVAACGHGSRDGRHGPEGSGSDERTWFWGE